ncbi:MAG: hypothetical protein M1839_003852 [Geoglossum umbratile]|nr:MAG: hypothetical protein M1839_003852 [Geoglossum umbratile]
MATPADIGATYALVQDRYGTYARQHDDKAYSQKVATAFGYSPDELESIPDGANLGVSCGNPTAMASLVADMLALAHRNAQKSLYSSNVVFVESSITSIPSLSDSRADCIISNCVINLVPHEHKHLVFEEIWRLLKPGGRVAVSDILAMKELSEDIRGNLGLYVGCVAGASQVKEYEGWLSGVGFQDILIVDTHSDINIYKTAGVGIADQGHQSGTPAPAVTNCGTSSSTKPVGYCQPLSTTTTPASGCRTSSTEPTGCCQPLSTTTTPTTADKGAEEREQKKNPDDIDLNEWVGTSPASSPFGHFPRWGMVGHYVFR